MADAGGGTLWALIIGTVIFLASFVAFVGMIPSETYYPYKEYEQYYVDRDTLRAEELNMYNQSGQYNFTFGLLSYTEDTLSGLTIHFRHYQNLAGINSFGVYHKEGSFWVFEWGHQLNIEPQSSDYGNALSFTELFKPEFYDEDTDTSQVTFSCPHISVNMLFYSSNNTWTLAESWNDHDQISASIEYEIDFTSMGANTWVLLGSILTFQAIRTGILALDVLLNALITIPIWTSITYILYRIVTGLIPTLSGGGGA